MVSINILIASDHPIIRSSLRLMLERQPEFRVVAEAANGREAVVLAEYKRPDILVLDIKLAAGNGLAATKEISTKSERTAIVFVTTHKEEGYVSEAFKAGARGYVAADAAQVDLTRAIHIVLAGGRFISPVISSRLFDDSGHKQSSSVRVSDFDKQLCCLLAAGWEENEIASHLQIDVSVVESATRSLREALQSREIPGVIATSVRENQSRMNQA